MDFSRLSNIRTTFQKYGRTIYGGRAAYSHTHPVPTPAHTKNIRNVVDTIERRINAALAQKNTDDPLYIFIGETHSQTSHILTELAILDRLAQKGLNINLAIENEENTAAEKLFNHLINFEIETQDLDYYFDKLNEADKAGSLSALSYIGYIEPIYSRNTQMCLNTYISEKVESGEVNFQYNDFANNNYGFIPADSVKNISLTRKFSSAGQNTNQGVNPRGAAGMTLRNQHMLDELYARAEETKPDIVIQICGINHIDQVQTLGFADIFNPDSPVLFVPLLEAQENQFYYSSKINKENTVFDLHLPESKFLYCKTDENGHIQRDENGTTTPLESNEKDIVMAAERTYLKRMLTSLSLNHVTHNTDEKEKKAYQDVSRMFDQWIKEKEFGIT